MLGYAADEYIGHPVTEFHADRPVVDEMLDRLARGETLRNYPARLRCRDGSIRHVLISSNARWERGRFAHSRCVVLDVTERRQADEIRGLLAAVVESTEDAVITKSLEGDILSWNAGARAMLGYTAEEVVGRLGQPDHPGEPARGGARDPRAGQGGEARRAVRDAARRPRRAHHRRVAHRVAHPRRARRHHRRLLDRPRHRPAQGARAVAARQRPPQGRIPGGARPRAAQPARADPQRRRGAAADAARRRHAAPRRRHHRAAGAADVAAARRPARRLAHHPQQARAPHGAADAAGGDRLGARDQPAARRERRPDRLGDGAAGAGADRSPTRCGSPRSSPT